MLGGTGYVAGELLRLIAGHPQLELAGILSDSQPGEPVAKAFGHLAPVYPDTKFASIEEIEQLVATLPRSGDLLGRTAWRIGCADRPAADEGGKRRHQALAWWISPRTTAISTDAAYAAVYKHAHGAPARLSQFTCAVPEHLANAPTPHIGHPGCFATAILLASVPLLKLGIAKPTLFVSGVTGSTGSGRKPMEGTHHPTRHSDLYCYNALAHRHAPEVTAVREGRQRRGCALRIRAALRSIRARHPRDRAGTSWRSPPSQAELLEAFTKFYAHSPFVGGERDRAAREGRRRQQLRTPLGRHRWQDRRRDERARQPQQGRRRWRGSVDEPPAGPARNRRPHRTSRWLDLIDSINQQEP